MFDIEDGNFDGVIGSGVENGSFPNGSLVNLPEMTMANARTAREGLASLAKQVRAGVREQLDEVFLSSYNLPFSGGGNTLQVFAKRMSQAEYRAEAQRVATFVHDIVPAADCFNFVLPSCYAK